jgi:hypothetical protein
MSPQFEIGRIVAGSLTVFGRDTNRSVTAFESPELIALCASVLSDGEVSADEAYSLAEWLNKHPEAAQNWPGSELVKVLQELWADRAVVSRELHRLARVLTSVQREWARHPETNICATSNHSVIDLSQLKIDEVRLASFNAKFSVPSQSEPSRFYEVDLNGPSCTCPDWCTWRSNLPVGDLTRCCKHILSVYARLVRPAKTDNWLLAFIANAWPAHPGTSWHLMTVESGKVLFCSASARGWSNVFAMADGSYTRFGYNVEEERWAYGVEPLFANAIAAAITSLSA